MNTTVLNPKNAEAIGRTLTEMRLALEALAQGATLLTTMEALEVLPFKASAETLLAYPDFVLPRTAKNPRARRLTYLWDPRDLLLLPQVLRQWQVAENGGPEAVQEFERRRREALARRDREDVWLEAAA